jgi:hypothetical protein
MAMANNIVSGQVIWFASLLVCLLACLFYICAYVLWCVYRFILNNAGIRVGADEETR